ncbi:hypothetical protein SAMN05421837_10956 [Amycolatopsis pretoriensis]|uniref:Uncharacterized protein n=1 Tax=Amycolatopsis pretoriensis TaxID=218821 RepID=A0A1H5RC15_9PSEU|nr:hypothetical protein [Amycolatopsis pretoriensis]SEF35899.1 hypothetical protein SAMN05421837_10956 [Amycolatopsis pretoriensis]
MSDDLGLPPRRALPDDVRDRLRAEVRAGIGAPRRTHRVWYAAAAAVLVLAAGAVVATKTFREQPVAGPPPDPGNHLTLDPKVATAALDRCWAAVQAAGKTDRVPPRAEWVPLFTEVLQADAVVAATAAGKPMFCETTETTVTVSDPAAAPAYAPGTHVGVLLHSATGTVAGIVDPGTAPGFLGSRTEGGENMSQSIRTSPVSGQFVAMTRTALWTTTLTVETPGAPRAAVLPQSPPWLVMSVDRPVTAERTSPAGRALDECLNTAEEVTPDAAAYAPGPLLDTGDFRVVMGRRGDRVVVCETQPDYQRPGRTKSRAFPGFIGPQTQAARTLTVDTLGAAESGAPRGQSRHPFAAALPLTAAKATIDFGIGTSVEADVVDGMVAAWVPGNIDLLPDATVHVRARDSLNRTVYDGSLRLR